MKKRKTFILVLLLALCTFIGIDSTRMQAEEEAVQADAVTIESVDFEMSMVPLTFGNGQILKGVGVGFEGYVYLSDGTVAINNDLSPMEWEVTTEDGSHCVSYLSVNNAPTTGQGGVVRASSDAWISVPYTEANRTIKITVRSIADPTKIISKVFTIGGVTNGDGTYRETFYTFSQGEVPESTITGRAAIFTEIWNADTNEYSVTLPENTYQANGYRFVGWQNGFGKVYQPGEVVTLHELQDWKDCKFSAVWERAEQSIEVKPSTSPNTGDPTNMSALLGWMIVGGAIMFVARTKRN